LHRDGHSGNLRTWSKLVEITDAETIVQQHNDKAAWLWFARNIDCDRISLAIILSGAFQTRKSSDAAGMELSWQLS
jgi:hypothetical protein